VRAPRRPRLPVPAGGVTDRHPGGWPAPRSTDRWQLLEPPKVGDWVKRPLAEWLLYRAYPSAAACEKDKDELIDRRDAVMRARRAREAVWLDAMTRTTRSRCLPAQPSRSATLLMSAPDAPDWASRALAEWTQVSAHDSVAVCEQARQERIRAVSQLVQAIRPSAATDAVATARAARERCFPATQVLVR